MLTFEAVKADLEIQAISGFGPNSPEFASLVNRVCRTLLRRGDWAGTVVPIYLCVRKGCIVWPRYVQTVRALSWCGRGIEVKNMWGDFLPRGPHEPWRSDVHWQTGNCCSSALVQKDRSSVYQDVQGEGRLLRAYARVNADYGKTITIFGQDNNGQDLIHQDSTGAWVPGLVLTLASPFVSTSVFVRHIDYVLKDVTEQPVNLYAYWVAEAVLEDIAQYEPGDTRPSFQRTRVNLPWAGTGACNLSPTTTSCCGSPRGLAALVKLRFIDARFDTDIIIPDNLDAIRIGIQSAKFGNAGDIENKKLFEADAIAELNRQLEDESPDDQFVADNYVFAGQTFTNHCF